MNIYFCYEAWQREGLYIVAKSENRARSLYSGYTGISFIRVRCRTVLRNVEGEEDILEVGNEKLKKYGISYYNEKGEELQ